MDKKVLRKTEEGSFVFMCPACRCGHWFNDTWQFDGDFEKPTISPSILVTGANELGDKTICHSFVKNGVIDFLGDCTHELRGAKANLMSF